MSHERKLRSQSSSEYMEGKILKAISDLSDQVKKSNGGIESSALTLLETLSRQQQTHQSELESLKNRLSVQEGEVAGLKQENARLKYRETVSESRIERLEKTIVKQKEQILDLKARSMRDNVVFYSIKEEKNETPEKTQKILNKFLKEKMKIEEPVKFDRVHRMGQKSSQGPRPIVAKCNPSGGKDRIMKKCDSLNQTEWGVSDQYPQEWDEERRKLKAVIKEKKDNDPNVVCKLRGNKLYINNELYSECKPENMIFTEDDIAESESIELEHSEPIIAEGSTFVGHAARISETSLSKATLLKAFQDKRVASASHNIYAYRIKDSNGKLHEYSNDDGEFRAGRRLLNLLQDNQFEDTMVICTRWYGGKHLGPSRFDRIEEAAKQAIDKL